MNDPAYIRPAAASAFLTAVAVATRWGCSAKHVTRLARNHQVRAMKLGHVWRFHLADIEDYEQAHTVEVATPTKPAKVYAAPSLPEQWWNTDFWADADRISASRGRRR